MIEKITGIEGNPTDAFLGYLDLPLKEIKVGFWKGSTGTFTVERDGFHEIVLILTGSGLLVSEEGVETPHQAGDLVHIPEGWKGTWRVDEEITKIFISAITA
ncbi:MAG: cupin domain-containing protein [Microbacteriaceae bacterium]